MPSSSSRSRGGYWSDSGRILLRPVRRSWEGRIGRRAERTEGPCPSSSDVSGEPSAALQHHVPPSPPSPSSPPSPPSPPSLLWASDPWWQTLPAAAEGRIARHTRG